MLTFSDFIRLDKNSSTQRSKLQTLNTHTDLLHSLNLQPKPTINPSSHSIYSYLFTTKEKDISYKLEKLRLKLQDKDRNCEINLKRVGKKIKESKRFAWIFILALLDKNEHYTILKMLMEKDFDVNQPVFRIKYLPSYFYLACVLGYSKMMVSGDYMLSWNGMSTGVLGRDTFKGDNYAMMSTTQFKCLVDLKEIFNCMVRKEERYFGFYDIVRPEPKAFKFEKALFLGDLISLKQDIYLIQKMCKNYSKSMKLAWFTYLLQKDTEIVLTLLRHNINPYPHYYGISPLHIAAKEGNMELVTIYLELGFLANDQDFNGNTPLHYAAYYGNRECYDYITQKKYNIIDRTAFDKGTETLTNNQGLKPIELLKTTNKNEKIGNPEEIIKRLRVARKAAAMERKRFTIINGSLINFKDKQIQYKEHIKKMEGIPMKREKVLEGDVSYKLFDVLINGDKRKLGRQENLDSEAADFFEFFNN